MKITIILEIEEIEDFSGENIWVTAAGRKVKVKDMSTVHIENCIKCWTGKGDMKIPSWYLGGKKKWLKIFNNELIKRQ